MKQLGVLLIILFTVLLLTSCNETSIVCDSCFQDPTNCTSACRLPVDEGDNFANLYMQVNVTAGAISWTLWDSNGNVQWDERYEAGDRPELITYREFPTPAAGDWHLELDLQDAIGEYKCVWKTQ